MSVSFKYPFAPSDTGVGAAKPFELNHAKVLTVVVVCFCR
jgi:hypothetical protein